MKKKLYFNFQGFDAFESISHPGSFIRHKDYRLRADIQTNDQLYKSDASFKILRGKFYHIS